jgi:stage V sporulation protein D (sporulation-specific penicillin-binding protein)
MNRTEIQQHLVNLRIEVSGEGKTVVKQSPSPGIKVKEGSTIRLYMDSAED